MKIKNITVPFQQATHESLSLNNGSNTSYISLNQIIKNSPNINKNVMASTFAMMQGMLPP